MINIVHRFTRVILYHSKTAQTIAKAITEAIHQGANLRGAHLQDANFQGANLRGAHLLDADLRGVDLRGANLLDADLRGADLRGADLRGVDLQGVDLQGAHLLDADLRGANLRGVDLQGVDLRGAHLLDADLRGANLRGVDLQGADLRGANLLDADLRGADLRGADLRGAKRLDPYFVTPLLMLFDQPGTIRAYKLVTADGVGPYNGGIVYMVNQTYEVSSANTDPTKQCGEGINLATLDWCMHKWKEGYRILTADFIAADIAAIPTATDGKFRVRRCTISGIVDLVKIGLVKATETEQS